MEDERIANVVSRVFLEEAAAIRDLDSLSFECANAIAMISSSDDPLIVSGIGKSGHIGNKLASTFCSLGKPAIFMHAAEASHGDLGLIGKIRLYWFCLILVKRWNFQTCCLIVHKIAIAS